MHTSKQQAINHYIENMEHGLGRSYNKVDDVVWVNADKMLAILNEHALLKETVAIKLPPMVEADWDTNDKKEFDYLLQKILFSERTIH